MSLDFLIRKMDKCIKVTCLGNDGKTLSEEDLTMYSSDAEKLESGVELKVRGDGHITEVIRTAQ